MAVLITGLGYLGIPLAAELLRRGERVVGLENYFSTPLGPVRDLRAYSSFTLVEGSIASPRSVERAFAAAPISTIYHLAAQPSAHPQAAPASYTERVNLTGSRILLETAPRGCTLVFGSSFRVYGDELPDRVTEQTCYGRMADLSHLSKIYVEKLLELHAHRDGIRTIAVRLGVVYGIGPVMKTNPCFMTVPNLFCLVAARGHPLQLHPGATRPLGFIHLQDAVGALLAAAGLAGPGYMPFNAVTEMLSVAQVAEIVVRLGAERGLTVRLNGEVALGTGGVPTVESSLYAAGFHPRRVMQTSLGEVLDYFASHSDSFESLPAGAATR